MGRLDDAAKRKVVELRQAGLSFRKIKAVLELENIKVSAQAIYLFLKELKVKCRPLELGGGATQQQPGAAASGDGSDGAGGGRQAGWGDQQVWSLLRDSSRASSSSGYASPQDSTQQQQQQQGGAAQRAGGRPSSADGAAGGGRMEQQMMGGRKDDAIRIVSVTSLARGGPAQHGGPQMAGAGAMMGAGMRRKVPMSPASSAILVARKRLLDKALLHKARMREMSAQAGQQAGQLYGRGQACFQGNDTRKVAMPPQSPTLDLTATRPLQVRGSLESHPDPSVPKRTLQRPGPPARTLHPPFQRDAPPCIAVRPPNPAPPAPPAGQGHAGAARAQPPPNPPPRASPDGVWRGGGGLPEQMQALGAEIRGLGMAVRLMAEQQSRVEREQAQQTLVQRQILSTLQALASVLRPAKTPTPPGPGPAPYRRDSHTPTRPTYAQCSQPPLSKYCELEASGLESLESSYKLPGLGSPRVNGFQACAAATNANANGGLGLGPGQAPAYTPPYAEPHAEVFAQSYGSPPYSAQSHAAAAPAYSQAYPTATTHAQPADYPAAAVVATADRLRGCSPAINLNPDSPLSLSPDDPQLNIIKVESM